MAELKPTNIISHTEIIQNAKTYEQKVIEKLNKIIGLLEEILNK